jgi:hypothetical protein
VRRGRLDAALGLVAADRWWRLVGSRPRIHSLRSALGRLAGRRHRLSAQLPRPWLTERGLGAVDEGPAFDDWRRPSQAWALLHPSGALGVTTEPYHAARCGLEIRRPYRDRRLIEYVLALPADQLYRPAESKRILRRAMRGRLPEGVRTRRHPTSMRAPSREGSRSAKRKSPKTCCSRRTRFGGRSCARNGCEPYSRAAWMAPMVWVS